MVASFNICFTGHCVIVGKYYTTMGDQYCVIALYNQETKILSDCILPLYDTNTNIVW